MAASSSLGLFAYRSVELLRNGKDVRSFVLENARSNDDLRVDILPLFLFNRLADRGKRFRFVTRVLAGSVYEMLEPGAPRESLFECQLVLALHQRLVNFCY